MKPEQYAKLWRALGVDSMDEDTPIVAVIYKPADKQKIEDWIKKRARQDNDIDDDQADITEDPEKPSKKQLGFIKDLREKKVDGDEIYQAFLQDAGVGSEDELLRGQASVLIDTLQLQDDKAEEPAEKPKKKPGRPKKK